MNERIKEIGRQAGFAFISDGVFGQRWYESKCGMDKAEFEKFAELIVRDCISQIAMIGVSNCENNDVGWTVDKSIENIRKNFGVEE